MFNIRLVRFIKHWVIARAEKKKESLLIWNGDEKQGNGKKYVGPTFIFSLQIA